MVSAMDWLPRWCEYDEHPDSHVINAARPTRKIADNKFTTIINLPLIELDQGDRDIYRL